MPFVTLRQAHPGAQQSIHYQLSGAGSELGTLVCIHELGGSLESMQAFAALMAPHCRVLRFDQRGAGLSEHPVKAFTIEDLAVDVHDLLGELGLEGPIHLLGLAMGAVTALRYAIQHSDRLASLVLCDGTSEIEPEASRYILERAATVRAQGMRAVAAASFANAFRGMPEDKPLWDEYRHRFLGNAPGSYALHSEALAALRFDDEELAQVKCPTLVLSGAHDFIWPPEVGQHLASRIPGSRFLALADAAHFPPIQCPGPTAEIVSAFLSRRD